MNLLSDCTYALGDEATWCPGAFAAAYPVEKVLDYRLPVWGVNHLRVKLQTEDVFAITYNCGGGILSVSQGFETGWHFYYLVAMAHPNWYRSGQAGKARRLLRAYL